MAIGLGRMLGFKLPENFARPYSSASITEFWRRWHMSLSRWFRDYLYIPLGGNRHGVRTTYRNLWIVFALVGFWHGAKWTFLLWGLYHGTMLVIERRRGWAVAALEPERRMVRRVMTLLIVVFGWVLFRSSDMSTALIFLQHMVIPDLDGLTDVVAASLTHQRLVILLLSALVFLLPTEQGHLESGGRPWQVMRLAELRPSDVRLLHGMIFALLRRPCDDDLQGLLWPSRSWRTSATTWRTTARTSSAAGSTRTRCSCSSTAARRPNGSGLRSHTTRNCSAPDSRSSPRVGRPNSKNCALSVTAT